MARLTNGIASLLTQHHLARAGDDLRLRLERLSTGLRINRAADDPAGLVVAEMLRSERVAVDRAIGNAERAISVVATADGALGELSDLLVELRGLVVEASSEAARTADERTATQLQIDSILATIDRLAATTRFGDLALLDGSLGYLVDDAPASAITFADVHSIEMGARDSRVIQLDVVASAQVASLFLSGNTAGAPGALLSSLTIEIAGNEGVQMLTFVSGTTLSAVAAAVTSLAGATGVEARLVDDTDQTSGLRFVSTGYGADRFVSVRRVGDAGAFFALFEEQGAADAIERDAGRDVVIHIDGHDVEGRGLGVSVLSPALDLDLELTADAATRPGVMHEFTVSGGGTGVQIAAAVGFEGQIRFGIGAVASSRLGGSVVDGARLHLDALRTGGALAVDDGSRPGAGAVVDAAITQVARLRGRLGALDRETLIPSIQAHSIALENLAAGESLIRDADFAEETAALARAQILMAAGHSVLAAATTRAADVLRLLAIP